MEEARRSRRSARSWVTRQVNRVRNILREQSIDMISLQNELKELNTKTESLISTQEKFEFYLDDEELEKDIEEADTFLNSMRELKVTAEKYLRTADSDIAPSPTMSEENGRQKGVNAQLPKIEIKKFSGQYEEWPEFWDKFSAIIDNTNMPIISKFSYLQSLLEAEARTTIQGLSLTESNYNVATTLLKDRYGRKERIIFAHIQRLLNIEVKNVNSTNKLWQIYNELQTNIRSLENLGVSGKEYGVVLTPMVLSRLPHEFRLEWARISDGKEGDLNWLMQYLKDEISRRERSETYLKPNQQEERYERRRQPSAAVLQNNGSSNIPPTCCFCNKKHDSSKCWNLKKMETDEIREVIRGKNLCFRCFGPHHIAKGCTKRCETCAGNHNKWFCAKYRKETFGQQNSSTHQIGSGTNVDYGSHRSDKANLYHHSKFTNKITVMQTISVLINDAPCTVLFDSGSDKSYITSSCVKRVKPKYVGHEQVSYTCFGERRPKLPSRRNVYEIDYSMTNRNKKSFVVTEIPTITAPMYREKIPVCFLEEFGDLGLTSLKDKYNDDENISIDILIGLDAYWNLMTHKVIATSHGLVAQESIFGWLLSGSYPIQGQRNLNSGVHHQNLCLTDLSDSLVRSFWELEHIGIKTVENEKSPDQTLESFNEKVQFVGDRFQVDLPWVEDRKLMLENNFDQAKQRLSKLEKKLDTDPKLKDRYNMVLSDLTSEGIFEEVPIEEIDTKEHPVFYLPHRPVVKETSETTKVRPVFDASAAGPNGVTLNSCMNTGPNMTTNLLEILLRFRRWKCALSGDITKAFFQVQVNKLDRDVHRFLMKQDSSLQIMRITRVPFGNTSSPFLLNATIKYHLSRQPSSRVVEELSDNLYVDDWLTGADSVDELLSLKDGAESVMKKASMPLTKWCSNLPEVAEQKVQIIKEKDDDVSKHKVLGIQWIPAEDSFSFVGFDLSSPHLVITRRVVLSCISRIFDPLGFLQPFVMVGKIIFQSLWKEGVQWDNAVSEEVEKNFLSWMIQTKRINEFKVPRCYVKCAWGNKKDLEIHAFSDASEKGYGSCVYLKITEADGSVTTSLVIAKAKLTPVKRVTLPRLELLGAVLSARLVAYVKKSLQLPESTSYRCWTDSMVALQWIRSDANKWKTFVANRVTEIQKLTSPEFWGHCKGSENPADMLSRGVKLDGLLTSTLWFHGPSWLRENSGSGHIVDSDSMSEDKDVEEENVECAVQLSTDSVSAPILPVERWGDFSKSIRIVAWILRFVSNCRCKKERRKVSRDLRVEDIESGKILLLRSVQGQYFSNEVKLLQKGKSIPVSSTLYKLNPFLANDGLIRLKGRLQFSNLSFGSKHPVILPRCHVSELIVRREHVQLKHAGVPHMISSVRNEYWVIGMRKLARKVKHECPRCIRFDSLPCQQPMAPLPKERAQRSEPFSVTGIDYAGPLFSADNPGVKHYICLFTCATIRAVHLELVDNLSLAQFMLAFKRFVARRRLPTTILSDQAQTFKAAAKKITEIFSDKAPVWKFITPRSPWVGGMWERMVRSVKSSLKKCLGLRCLTKLELSTLLCEIEQCINSRPLTFVGDTIDSSEVLTPIHFLNGGKLGSQTSIILNPKEVTTNDVTQMVRARNEELERFWTVWSNDYIRHLPHAPVAKPRGRIKVGSVVLIKHDNSPKLRWPLGLITRVFPGKDNLIRTVEVKTQRGLLIRPIQRIYNLEVNNCEPPVGGENDIPNNDEGIDGLEVSMQNIDDDSDVDKEKEVVRTRAGRVVKSKRLLDL